MRKIEVSIIYVNYNTSKLIADSLISVFNLVKDISFEIIIVDNNSEKDLERKLTSFIGQNAFNIKYIYLEENIGFGRANNVGAKIAEGEYLFLLNPDTILLNNAIKILNDFIKSRPKVGVVGGNLVTASDMPCFSFRKIFPGPDWDFQEFTHHIFRYPLNPRKCFFNFSDKPVKVAYIAGADLMIKKSIFQSVNGFPDDLFMYWDDVALCKLVRDLGYLIYNVPQAKIKHLVGESFNNINLNKTLKFELIEKYRFVYLRKYLSKPKVCVSNFFYKLFLDSRILFLSSGNKKQYYKIRRNFYKKFLKLK
ncbi:MAG: glycosyltransferase family 2 protein [Muribaculaceae bacterium]|nr:glycosyltransferase family 2 protein [Muribaculaceae bacterium]